MSGRSRYGTKDNEFIAWYPPALSPSTGDDVWRKRDAGFYLHIPYCTAICDYCGFSVQRIREGDPPRYVDALRTEIERYAAAGRLSGHRFVCGHFGGGTPSALPADQLVGLLDGLRDVADVTPDAEITVEVNPLSVDREKLETYRAGGVNRLSLGIQSFDERILRTIGRPHRRADVEQALRVTREAGFDNHSLDLIYGVPGQTERDLREDLERAIETGATHLTCFRLEIIPFTVLKLREAAGQLPPRLDTEQLDAMDDLVADVLDEAGLRPYGGFNFARPGYESVHNDIAFTAPQGEYFGFGNSAYSYVNDRIYANSAVVEDYLEQVGRGQDPIAFSRPVSALDQMARYFVLGLKFFRVPRAPFVERFGMTPEQVFGEQLTALTGDGLLVREGDDYVLTRDGWRYVNDVCKEFYIGDNRGQSQYIQFVPTLTADQINRYARKAGLGTAADLAATAVRAG